ncbi:MAG: HD family phosphohydrolase [Bacilli bacterium]|nr:HD family phosphohydrolase [Bacilli bacterium]
MMDNYNEFYNIIDEVLTVDKFQEMKNIPHHGITRYDHLMRVSYYSYLICKKLHLNYREAAIGGLLHDFFTTELADSNSLKALVKHPKCALNNADKYFTLTDREKDIIRAHMFPVTIQPPKYLESWIVDMVDNGAAIYEKGNGMKKELKTVATFLLILFINIMKFR